MFIAALFTVAKLWNQLGALQLMNGERKCDLYVKNTVLLSNKEE
jgi:hypothetical protein